jgi:uncharacterized protein (DUF58 family)
VNTLDRRAREAYRAARAEARERAHKSLRQIGVDHVTLSTAQSYLPPLLRYFAERRRRR